MEGSICLTVEERKLLLQAYRSGRDALVARRAHVILLRARGWTWQEIQATLFCSTDLIIESLRRFAEDGVAAVLEQPNELPEIPEWLMKVKHWLTTKIPQDFGDFRSRWSCELLANLLAWETGQRLSGETIRRGLHRLEFAYRRPRPIVGPTDPHHVQKLRRIQGLLASLPDDEVAVFQDEVDVHLNPKIGSAWMPKGEQARVRTPGNNRKCHVAGSLVWGTGTLLVSPPEARRNTEMFLAHLDDLRRRLRGWKKIHVVCDNAAFHK
ncbi:MAG: Transposase [Schlesneria sp.]|nr:Transposase [Schlesneria sp.]